MFISIGEIVTRCFTLIVLSALRCSGNENMLSLMNLTYVLERFNTSPRNPINEILLKLNIPDHRILKDGGEDTCDEVLKLKNFKKDALLKLFKKSNQERYEHVGPKVTSSQDGKSYKMEK
ncbi:hypothetical protein Tco_0886387 [Tanacetum coccineum]